MEQESRNGHRCECGSRPGVNYGERQQTLLDRDQYTNDDHQVEQSPKPAIMAARLRIGMCV
jgi:hypothetical protein